MGFPGGSSGQVSYLPGSAGDMRDLGSVPGTERSSREGHGKPLQYSCLDNPMDRGAWQATSKGSHRVRHDLAHKRTNINSSNHKKKILLTMYDDGY